MFSRVECDGGDLERASDLRPGGGTERPGEEARREVRGIPGWLWQGEVARSICEALAAISVLTGRSCFLGKFCDY